VLVIHGPNLNLLGTREPHIYGTTTLAQIDTSLRAQASAAGAEVETVQLNGEGEIITKIQDAKGHFDGLLINAASYTHTSVGIRDAIEAVSLPAIEVHLSNVHRREEFRHRSFIAGACVGLVLGFGAMSYTLALDGLLAHLSRR
jgi:3-dehydroquinate dehydratase II